MIIVCPSCEASYDVPEKVVSSRRTVRCARCGNNWSPGDHAAAAPAVQTTVLPEPPLARMPPAPPVVESQAEATQEDAWQADEVAEEPAHTLSRPPSDAPNFAQAVPPAAPEPGPRIQAAAPPGVPAWPEPAEEALHAAPDLVPPLKDLPMAVPVSAQEPVAAERPSPRAVNYVAEPPPPAPEKDLRAVLAKEPAGPPTIAWVLSVAAVTMLIIGMLVFKDPVMKAWPPSTRLYALLGLYHSGR
jgi:predicted Zn finger-like uncharacterized protein